MIPNDPNQHKPRDRKKVILRLGKYLLQHKWMVLAAVSLTITGNLLALLGPMLSGYAIDAIGVGPGQTNFDLVLFYCGLMLVFYVLSSGLSYLLSVLMVKISQKIVYQMRKDLVDKLLELGACYKAEDGAVMYRSAQYAAKYGTVNKKKTEDGTEEQAKDEVLVRANGIPTYFAADIAYHYNKLATRGFDKAIDVWGADHHGHVARMKGAMDAIGLDGSKLDVVLMQMVNLMRDGQPVRMSKRTGNAITLTDLLEEVPIDSARFLFNMHDAGSGIDFDLDQAVKTDNDNPVYYVQYAHARICSILKKLASEGVPFAGADQVDPSLLTDPTEMDLVRMLAAFPQEIVLAAEKYDPSRLNRFVIDLASAFHRFYGNCRIQGADPAVQQARLALCTGVKQTICNVLTMFKINVPEKM